MPKQLIVLISLLAGIGSSSFAQNNFVVDVVLDSTVLYIGEQSKITFEVVQDKGAVVNFPVFTEQLTSGIDIVNRFDPDTLEMPNSRVAVRQSYLITSFDSALYFIPQYPFVSGTDTLLSRPLSLKVLSITVDTTQTAISDIKPNYNPPFDWLGLGKSIVIFILLNLLLAIAIYLLTKVIRKKPIFPIKSNQPKMPAHVLAFEELERIKVEELWQHGQEKEYHTRLSNTLRLYIEQRYNIHGMELTSSELILEMKPLLKDNPELLRKLGDNLQLADLVKFAKWKPMPEEDQRCFDNAYQFVDQTKFIPEELVAQQEKETKE